MVYTLQSSFIIELNLFYPFNQTQIRTTTYGRDLNSVQATIAQSKADLQAIREFQVNIDKCKSLKVTAVIWRYSTPSPTLKKRKILMFFFFTELS